jgi:hypothetical protein
VGRVQPSGTWSRQLPPNRLLMKSPKETPCVHHMCGMLSIQCRGR